MKKIASMIVLFVLSIVFTGAASAEDIASGYSISPVFSQHQSEGVTNFYDIIWTPSSVDHFELEVKNNTDHEQTYEIQVNKARTNKNGIVDYSDNTPEKENTSYKLTEMIEMPQEVTVAAHSSKNVEGNIAFSDKDFNGILMGGIHVSEKKAGNEKATVSNSVAYNIPFVVRGNIDKRPDPILELNLLKVEQFSSDIYALDMQLENKGPNLMKEVNFSTEIKNSAGEKIVSQDSQLDITPETEFTYPIKLPSNIKEGKYMLILKVKHSEKNEWHFNKTFKITQQDVKKIRKDSMNENWHWFVYIGIFVIGSYYLVSLYLGKYFKKRN